MKTFGWLILVGGLASSLAVAGKGSGRSLPDALAYYFDESCAVGIIRDGVQEGKNVSGVEVVSQDYVPPKNSQVHLLYTSFDAELFRVSPPTQKPYLIKKYVTKQKLNESGVTPTVQDLMKETKAISELLAKFARKRDGKPRFKALKVERLIPTQRMVIFGGDARGVGFEELANIFRAAATREARPGKTGERARQTVAEHIAVLYRAFNERHRTLREDILAEGGSVENHIEATESDEYDEAFFHLGDLKFNVSPIGMMVSPNSLDMTFWAY
jgi:hypothetical protein